VSRGSGDRVRDKFDENFEKLQWQEEFLDAQTKAVREHIESKKEPKILPPRL
jgi:hypothetical protein